MGLLVSFVMIGNRRHRRLRKELGLPALVAQTVGGDKGRWLGFAGASVGAIAWMIGFAIHAHDRAAAVVVTIAAVIAVIACRRFVPGRHGGALRRFATIHVACIGVFTCAI